MKLTNLITLSVIYTIFILLSYGCSGGTIPVNPPDDNPDPGDNEEEINTAPTSQFIYEPVKRTYIQGDIVNFDGTPSTDAEMNIVKYEWDLSYDDSTFLAKAAEPKLSYKLPSFGSVVAALRVTDSGTTPLSDISRTRLNVQPVGEISQITDGNVDDFLLRKVVCSGDDFYVLYTGTIGSHTGAYVQRSSDAGAGWGDPVIISSNTDDSGPWGVWMDAAPFGIVLGWMANSGEIKYTYGQPTGTDSVTFAVPEVLGTATVVVEDKGYIPFPPVVYSISCTPDGTKAFLIYMTTGSSSLHMIVIDLDNGTVKDSKSLTLKDDTEMRYNFAGASVAATSTGRAYIAYIWKSIGYDNLDRADLLYIDSPYDTVQGPIRVDKGLDGFIYNHDPYVIVDNNDQPIVYFRTTGIWQGGKDTAVCFSEGNPPEFLTAVRGNNTLGDDPLAAQNSPCVTVDRDSGNTWIAFEDFRDSKKVSQVYVNMLDKLHSTILPDFDISDDPAKIYSDINPQICYRAGDNPALIVVWERNGTDIISWHASY